ncbi:MAG: hypothetical protein HOQ45_17240 [Nocardioidaceae bacterium]|nr:hypothetical protein [Nocardioidaceae bacterium]
MTLLRHLGALLAGAAVAFVAVLVHGSAFPVGLLVAVAATYAVPLRLLRSRWPRTASTYALGWLGVFAVVLAGRPEGDYLVAGDLAGYAFMAAGFGLVLVAILGFTTPAGSDP